MPLVAPLVFIMPGSLTYQRGEDVVLNCSVIGGPDTSYQWQFEDINIDGENSSMLTLPSVNASNGGEYTCVVTNSAGNDSARVFVFILPYFVMEPQNENGLNGSMVTLPCEAETFPAPDIQWIKVGDTIRDGLSLSLLESWCLIPFFLVMKVATYVMSPHRVNLWHHRQSHYLARNSFQMSPKLKYFDVLLLLYSLSLWCNSYNLLDVIFISYYDI